MSKNTDQSLDVTLEVSGVEYRKVGKVKEAHGLKGDLYILIFSEDLSWVESLEFIVLGSATKNQNNRYEVQTFRAHKEGIIIKLKGVDDRNQSELLKGNLFYVPTSTFESEEDSDDFYLAEIEGFEVVDVSQGPIGPIENFSFNGVYDVLHVQYQNQTVEIPLVEEWIEVIDFESKQVRMTLPEGLLAVQINPESYGGNEE